MSDHPTARWLSGDTPSARSHPIQLRLPPIATSMDKEPVFVRLTADEARELVTEIMLALLHGDLRRLEEKAALRLRGETGTDLRDLMAEIRRFGQHHEDCYAMDPVDDPRGPCNCGWNRVALRLGLEPTVPPLTARNLEGIP